MFELKSNAPGSQKNVQMYNSGDGSIFVQASEGPDYGDIQVNISVAKTELRDYLAREFDWTIIDRGESPLASWERELLYGAINEPENMTAEHAKSLALHYAERAVELKKKENEQIEGLAELVKDMRPLLGKTDEEVAKTLFMSGRITVKVEKN